MKPASGLLLFTVVIRSQTSALASSLLSSKIELHASTLFISRYIVVRPDKES